MTAATGEASTSRAWTDDEALPLNRIRIALVIKECQSSYPVSHLGMRSARELEMKMKIAKRMS